VSSFRSTPASTFARVCARPSSIRWFLRRCAQVSDGSVGRAMTHARHGELTQRYSGRRRESRQGSMRSRRTITLTSACLMTLSLLAALPVAASAGSLLSGYGGPGQGSQAIIGASLVNGGGGTGGPRGGDSGGGSGAGAGPASSATSSVPTGTSPGGTVAVRSRPGKHVGGAGSGKRRNSPVGSVSAGGSEGSPAPSSSAAARLAAARLAPEGASTLGLSRENLLFVLLALGALILTGFFTRRMAGPARRVGAGS
jgi:hypothetical protein